MDEAVQEKLPPALTERLRLLADPANQGAGLTGFDWLVLILSCIALPIALIVWGWPQ